MRDDVKFMANCSTVRSCQHVNANHPIIREMRGEDKTDHGGYRGGPTRSLKGENASPVHTRRYGMETASVTSSQALRSGESDTFSDATFGVTSTYDGCVLFGVVGAGTQYDPGGGLVATEGDGGVAQPVSDRISSEAMIARMFRVPSKGAMH